jgi:hypothetical protein
MATVWAAKAPGDVYRYTWTPALTEGDGVASFTASAAGAVIDSDTFDGAGVYLFVSGGTAGTTARFELTATTLQGEVLVDTAYLPIVASDANGTTARDFCEFALRKVYGKDETPEASALADALERLNDMLRGWAATGADVGATFPLAADTVVYCKPEFEAAIKNNLIVQIADLYDLPIGQIVQINAVRGLQLVKSANLPDLRAGAAYY